MIIKQLHKFSTIKKVEEKDGKDNQPPEDGTPVSVVDVIQNRPSLLSNDIRLGNAPHEHQQHKDDQRGGAVQRPGGVHLGPDQGGGHLVGEGVRRGGHLLRRDPPTVLQVKAKRPVEVKGCAQGKGKDVVGSIECRLLASISGSTASSHLFLFRHLNWIQLVVECLEVANYEAEEEELVIETDNVSTLVGDEEEEKVALTPGQRVDVLLKVGHLLEGRHEEEVTLYGDVEGDDGADDGRKVNRIGPNVLAGKNEVTIEAKEVG
ncbi:hypothetical protein TYRP_021220 [Tyrophagus putrescentiae]|nr:hypothetical protein TYRP_021220 [Tyrophagus putrescentiae]